MESAEAWTSEAGSKTSGAGPNPPWAVSDLGEAPLAVERSIDGLEQAAPEAPELPHQDSATGGSGSPAAKLRAGAGCLQQEGAQGGAAEPAAGGGGTGSLQEVQADEGEASHVAMEQELMPGTALEEEASPNPAADEQAPNLRPLPDLSSLAKPSKEGKLEEVVALLGPGQQLAEPEPYVVVPQQQQQQAEKAVEAATAGEGAEPGPRSEQLPLAAASPSATWAQPGAESSKGGDQQAATGTEGPAAAVVPAEVAQNSMQQQEQHVQPATQTAPAPPTAVPTPVASQPTAVGADESLTSPQSGQQPQQGAEPALSQATGEPPAAPEPPTAQAGGSATDQLATPVPDPGQLPAAADASQQPAELATPAPAAGQSGPSPQLKAGTGSAMAAPLQPGLATAVATGDSQSNLGAGVEARADVHGEVAALAAATEAVAAAEVEAPATNGGVLDSQPAADAGGLGTAAEASFPSSAPPAAVALDPSWLLSSQLAAVAEAAEAEAAEAEAAGLGTATLGGGFSSNCFVQPLAGLQAGEATCAPSVVSSVQHGVWILPESVDPSMAPPQPASAQPNPIQQQEQRAVVVSAYTPTPLQQQQPELGSEHESQPPQQQEWQPPSACTMQRTVSRRSGSSSSRSGGSAGRPSTADAAALIVPSPAQDGRLVMPPFPVERLQTAMGSCLSAMKDRLKTAVERELHLRFETEMAAVDREELVQARALAETNAEVDRQARQQAELELQHLSSSMEDERRRSQQEVGQLRGELRASHVAIRALERQVVSLQAELNAEVQRRQAVEQQLKRRAQQQSNASFGQGLQPPDGVRQMQQQLPAALPHHQQPQSQRSPAKPPFMGRLHTELSTPPRPCRAPRPLLQDVKQWLQSKQQEAAPWGPPPSIPTPPRSQTGSFQQQAAAVQAQEATLAEQRPSSASLWHRQQHQPPGQLQQQPATTAPWEQQPAPAVPWPPHSMPAAQDVAGYPQAQLAPAPRSRFWQRHGSCSSTTTSAKDPDSPSHQQLPGRRRQAGVSSAWTFKPAWSDGWDSSPSHRAAGRGSTAGPGQGPVDQVLRDLTDGLEQLRRSYSSPGSPYHTTARGHQQPHCRPPAQQAQQQHVAQPSSLMQPPPEAQQQGDWGFLPAAVVPMAIPPAHGLGRQPTTSLFVSSLPPPAAPDPPQGCAAPIIQYISTYHSPSSGGTQSAGGDAVAGRPPTAAVPSVQQVPPWVQQPMAPPSGGLPLPLHQYPLLPQLQLPPLPMPMLQPQQHQQVMLPVLEQRPHTPAVGLGPGSAPAPHAAATMMQQQQQQVAAAPPSTATALPSPQGIPAAGLPSQHTTGGGGAPGTARPPYTATLRSPGRNKDKPLAVPPQRMEESALEAARVQYMLDKHLIRAKRMRELAESPDFSLGAG